MLKKIAMSLLKAKLNDAQLKEFSNKYDEVQKVVSMAKNPKEALSHFGITNDDLKGAKGFLDNTLVQKGLGIVGISSEKAGGVIDSLTETTSVAPAPTDKLKAMQDNLARLRK